MNKIYSIEDIYSFKKKSFILKDLKDYDLSFIDLSKIPKEKWTGITIENTKFNYTNAKIIPDILGFHNKIYGCSFEGIDFEQLNKQNGRLKFIGCDFKNTNVNYQKLINNETTFFGDRRYPFTDDIAFIDCYLPDNFFDGYNKNIECLAWVDPKTIEKNPNLVFPEKIIFEAVSRNLKGNYCCFKDKVKDSVEFINKYDKSGRLSSFIKTFQEIVDNDREEMLRLLSEANVLLQDIKNIEFDSGILFELPVFFQMSKFENCSFNESAENLFSNVNKKAICRSKYTNDTETSDFINPIFPQINYGSWRDMEVNRISDSHITSRTNLYLELGRFCDANCEFCRNRAFSKACYNFDAIVKNLYNVSTYIDDLVIGGGEPTLLLKDLKKLLKIVKKINRDNNIEKYVFSNGSAKLRVYDYLNINNVSLNISRHAISDIENARILGYKDEKNTTIGKLKHLVRSGATMCATCFKGGLDSKEKILQYIDFADKLGAERILLSNLHLDNSSGKLVRYDNLNIDSNLFNEIILELKEQGFQQKEPIYSTGGYCSTSLETQSFQVVFKEYITKKDMDLQWNRASKRTFDLSISPDGKLYENWHQQDKEIILPNKVRKL